MAQNLQPYLHPFLDLPSLVSLGSTSSGFFVSLLENESIWKELYVQFFGTVYMTDSQLSFKTKFKANARRFSNRSHFEFRALQERMRVLLSAIESVTVNFTVGGQAFEARTPSAGIQLLQQGCMVQLGNLPEAVFSLADHEAQRTSLDQLCLGYQAHPLPLRLGDTALQRVWSSCIISYEWHCIRLFISAEAISQALLTSSTNRDPALRLLQHPHASLSYPPLARCLDKLSLVIEFCTAGSTHTDLSRAAGRVATEEFVLHGGMGVELFQPHSTAAPLPQDEWLRWKWYYNDLPSVPAVLKTETSDDFADNWDAGPSCFCLATVFWANYFPVAMLSLPGKQTSEVQFGVRQCVFGDGHTATGDTEVVDENQDHAPGCSLVVTSDSQWGEGYESYTFALSLSPAFFGRIVGRAVSPEELHYAKALGELNKARAGGGHRRRD
jgi:hypothetical protein